MQLNCTVHNNSVAGLCRIERIKIGRVEETKNVYLVPSLHDKNFHDGDLRKLLKFLEDL